ncbi:hypothetical protein P43SY_004097 [Pythium insidiosum]|uniref:HTH CENPB-type domain-containing protein n=1 Tax=Pythium insidiosum TaxID=114742 RepID=A0AAD5L7J9_PYTIN|nr:hypothetical protein P43SY_004097 [Pythium insidiosum]
MKIVQWVNVVRAEGVPISSQLFRWYAMEVAREAEIASFVASPTWQKRFLRASPPVPGQIRPEDAEARAASFAEKMREEMRELGVSVVYNADQTAVFFEYLPKRTINQTGTKTVWVRCAGKEKQRCTVMLLADSNGVTFDPTVVLKTVPSKHLHVRVENIVERQGFGRHVWKRIKPLQADTKLRILSNPTGWWNEYVHREFLQQHFGTRASVEEPVLLLLDEFSGHWTPETKAFAQKLNVHLMPVPPGLTSVCQPADVSWMRPFKDYLRHEWVSFLRHQVSEHVSRPGPPTPFKMRAPKDDDVCRWVRTAWDRVTPGTIMAGFPQLVLVDTTHKTNRYNYQLLTFMVMDEVGNGRSVQHSVLETNSDWHMHRGVQHFKRAHADSCKLVRVIMVDKDLNEIRVLEKHFPEAQVLICHFHVIKYLGIMCRKPDFGKMSSDDQTSIDAAVHGLVYAESTEEYEERNWSTCKEKWVLYCRAKLPHMKNHTNNRLESFFGKFKDGLPNSHSNNSDSDFEQRPTFGIRLNPVAKKTGRPVLDKAKKAGAAREQRLAYKKTEAARRDIGEVTLEDVLHRLEKEKPALSTTLTRLRKIPTKFGKEESRRPKYEVVNRPVLNEDAFYLLPKKLLKASIKCLPLTNTPKSKMQTKQRLVPSLVDRIKTHSSHPAAKTLLLPVNFGNTHWCGIIVDVEGKRICYYDSLSSLQYKSALEDLAHMIVKEATPGFNTVAMNSPVQFDGYSCGLFTWV